ncbi:hypothetical protein [Pseudomonas sp. 34 E 7]|nr:hypothetical protein [Pseudomonas sp. 34 E 7]
MQAVGVFVAGDVAEFIAFGDDFSVRVVAELPISTVGLGQFQQAPYRVPLILSQRAKLILTRQLPAQIVIAITHDASIGQLFFNKLPTLIPHQPMTTVVGIPDPGQLPLLVVAVVRRVAVRINPADDIALLITLVFPNRLTTPHDPYETIVMLVGCRLILTRKQRDQATGGVVLIRRHRAQRVLLDGQSALVVVGFEMLRAVRINALHQPRPGIVDIHFLAAIGVVHVDAAVIAPYIARVHLRKTGPVPDTARGFTRPFPRPKETRPTGQLPLKNDVLFVVPISLAFTDGIGRRHQSSGVVVGVGNDVLLGYPNEGLMAFGAMNLVVHRHNPT